MDAGTQTPEDQNPEHETNGEGCHAKHERRPGGLEALTLTKTSGVLGEPSIELLLRSGFRIARHDLSATPVNSIRPSA